MPQEGTDTTIVTNLLLAKMGGRGEISLAVSSSGISPSSPKYLLFRGGRFFYYLNISYAANVYGKIVGHHINKEIHNST